MNYAYEKAALLLLRISVAFSFLYPPLSAYFDPYSWIGYFPEFIKALAPSETLLLHGFGIIELIIGFWILSGIKIFWPSLIAGVMLVVIVVFNLPGFDVVFRDLSIAGAAFALALLSKRKNAVLA